MIHLGDFMLDNYECYYCCKTLRIDLGDGKTEVARAPWAGRTNGFTLLFGALIDQLCLVAPVNSVAKLMNVNDGKRFQGLSASTPQSPSRMPNDHDDLSHR